MLYARAHVIYARSLHVQNEMSVITSTGTPCTIISYIHVSVAFASCEKVTPRQEGEMAWEESWNLAYTIDSVSVNWTDNATECPPELTAAMHSDWVYKYFGECVMNLRQWFAFVIGMLSIACWLVAQVP